ncbi:NHL repeat-containing protein [Bacteroidota bacterium]
MAKLLQILFVVLLLSVQIYAQNISNEKIIKNFSEASSISINPAGMIFVSDIAANEIIKLDTLGNLLKSIGGYGWDEYSFDEPADIFATTLNVYVSDKNNNRIQIYDKDLNFLTDFNTTDYEDENYSFAYPVCSAVSNQGDIYILDSDNQRILKYDLRGELLQEIGNYEAGDFMLTDPKCFAISPDNRLFVADGTLLVIFDQFGMGLNKINLGFEPNNINITFNKLAVTGESRILLLDFNDSSYLLDELVSEEELGTGFIDALFFKNKLYILEKTKIRIFTIL